LNFLIEENKHVHNFKAKQLLDMSATKTNGESVFIPLNHKVSAYDAIVNKYHK